MKSSLLIVFLICLIHGFSQADTVRINRILQRAEHYKYDDLDSVKFYATKALVRSAEINYAYGQAKGYYYLAFYESSLAGFSKCIDYCDSAITYAQKGDLKTIQADALSLKGTIYSDLGELDRSIEYYMQSVEIAKQVSYDRGVNIGESNMGVSYYLKGDYQKSLFYFISTLNYFEESSDTINYLICVGNVSSIYTEMRQYDEALQYLEEGKKYALGSEDLKGYYAELLSQEAVIEEKRKNYEKSLNIYFEAIQIKKEVDDWRGVARIYNNTASVYIQLKQIEKAIQMSNRSIEIVDSLGFEADIAHYTKTMAIVLLENGRSQEALPYAERSLEIAKKMDSEEYILEDLKLLAEIHAVLKNFKLAYEMQLEYSELQDSVYIRNSDKAMEEMAVLHKLDKRELENAHLSEQNEKNEIKAQLQQEQLDRDKTRMTFMVFILLLVLVLAGISFFAYRNKKKSNLLISQQKQEVEFQKLEIERQHLVLEEVYTEVQDSIRYAKRIQAAILPPDQLIKKIVPESFVLYKPKDIVAGDFYWLQQKDDKVLFAAADCTGHGVPGAMVSVVCNNALNRSVREYGITDAGKILDKTRELVIEEFEKSAEDVKDGMDISLCSLSLAAGSLNWSGANNPLWILRKDGLEIEEIKADKQPIGKYAESKPFTSHLVNLNPGDTIYIFTDGFQDQFGGDKKKKFKSSSFKTLIYSLRALSMSEQKIKLEEAFDNWRGNLEQIDDVCVLGIRI